MPTFTKIWMILIVGSVALFHFYPEYKRVIGMTPILTLSASVYPNLHETIMSLIFLASGSMSELGQGSQKRRSISMLDNISMFWREVWHAYIAGLDDSFSGKSSPMCSIQHPLSDFPRALFSLEVA
jgi:hypothetical protein